MAGTHEKVSMIDDWNFANSSPRTLMSSYLSEEFASRSFSDFLAGKENEGIPGALEVEKMDMVAKVEEVETANNFPFESSRSGAHKANTHGGLAERIAANGFNVPKLNTARMGSANMASSSSNARSPYLTIPPGLSPTSLLESPVFLSNSMAQPSPTTGKLQFAQNGYTGASLVLPAAPNKSNDTFEDASESFAFKPTMETHSYSCSERKVISDFSHLQTLPSARASAQLRKHQERGISQADTLNVHNEEFSFHSDIKDSGANIFNQRATSSFMNNSHSVPSDNSQQDGDMDLKEELSSVSAGAPAEDGYNWRKYGQKQVKGSEYPRSYYKCTHSDCQVKKKVERSREGKTTEIIYKGTHKHPKPPPNRRSGLLLSHPFHEPKMDDSEQSGLQMNSDMKPIWASANFVNEGQDWQSDCLEAYSSAPVTTENCDPSTNIQQILHRPHFPSDAIDVSPTVSNDDDEDDCATLGSVSQGCDGEGDETESKRIKPDTSTLGMNAASRAVREPRVVVQTTSEVDILDDGYRWRKYGQKVVKGNPNPRSYYKCTHPGCNVRKHVERAAHDLKSVITTYEGKHNHEVPAARNSGQLNTATSNSTISPPQPHSLLPRADPVQAGLMRFEGHPPVYSLGHPPHSFAMGQPGFPSLTMAGLRSLAPMEMAVHPAIHSYMGHRPPIEGVFMLPKGEPNAEPAPESNLSMLNTGSMHPQKMMNGV